MTQVLFFQIKVPFLLKLEKHFFIPEDKLFDSVRMLFILNKAVAKHTGTGNSKYKY